MKHLKEILLIFSFTAILFGCISTKKAVSVLEKRNVLAGVCALKYPVDTVIKTQSDTVTNVDTVIVAKVHLDTLETKDTVRITQTVYQTKQVTKTIHDTKTVTLKDSAETAAFKLEIQGLKGKLSEANKKIETLNSVVHQKKVTNRWLIVAIFSLLTWINRKQIIELLKMIPKPSIQFLSFLKFFKK